MKLSNSSIIKFKNPCIFQYWFCLVFLLCFVVFAKHPLNDNFVIKEELVEIWWDNTKWSNDTKTNYSYDSEWKLTEAVMLEWKSEWVNLFKYNYQYDQKNNLIEYIREDWSTTENKWKLQIMVKYEYDSLNNLIEELKKARDGDTWIDVIKIIHTYDLDKLIEKIEYQMLNNWRPYYKYSFTYNPNNKISNRLFFTWNEDDSTWQNSEKKIYSYNQVNNLLELLYQKWSSDKWNDFLIKIYSYDSINNQIEEVVQKWESNINEWYNWDKYNFHYDSNNNKIETICQDWEEINGLEQWVNFYRYSYSYDQIVNIINSDNDVEKKSFAFKVLPSGVYFFIPQKNRKNLILSIYNLKGRKITTLKSEKHKNGIFFNLENVKTPSNTYIATFHDSKGNVLARQKLILMK